jgi:hypothetical protein
MGIGVGGKGGMITVCKDKRLAGALSDLFRMNNGHDMTVVFMLVTQQLLLKSH